MELYVYALATLLYYYPEDVTLLETDYGSLADGDGTTDDVESLYTSTEGKAYRVIGPGVDEWILPPHTKLLLDSIIQDD